MKAYLVAERRGDDAAVLVGDYTDTPPAEVFRDKLIAVEWALSTAYNTLHLTHQYIGPPPGDRPLGEVRQGPKFTAVKVRDDIGRNAWKVIGPDPELMRYGWRDDHDVRDWPVVGNVLEASDG